jgi:sterol desaturase/sphingolipid hydroxylase (fatty acid hydroxylase superfamily)
MSDSASLAGMIVVRRATGFSGLRGAAAQPGWLQFLELVLMADFLAYWFHRWLHRNPYLWRLHQVHHSSEQIDWLANVRLHPLDKFMGDCFQFVPIFWVGFSDGPLLAYTIALGFQGFLNHSNVRLSYGPLRWIIANPHFHHWHHCNHPCAYNRNFSPHLVIFDLLFGTALIPPEQSIPEVYGVPEIVPSGFWDQMIHPFRAHGGTINVSIAD